jgi:NADH-quinone oxidoreductase subunit A
LFADSRPKLPSNKAGGTRVFFCDGRCAQLQGLPFTMMWPLLVYFAFVIVLVAAVLLGSYLLGQRHSEPATGEPYEGGIASEGSARVRFSVRYYLVAMFFVVFDLEAVFLYAWAGAAREVGWAGYCEVLLFVGVLAAALIYLWKVGALDWVRQPRRPK